MKVFKVELMITDHDKVGEDGIISMLENTKFANWSISPTVMAIESREIEWTDDHPLNKFPTMKAAFEELFAENPYKDGEPGGDQDSP